MRDKLPFASRSNQISSQGSPRPTQRPLKRNRGSPSQRGYDASSNKPQIPQSQRSFPPLYQSLQQQSKRLSILPSSHSSQSPNASNVSNIGKYIPPPSQSSSMYPSQYNINPRKPSSTVTGKSVPKEELQEQQQPHQPPKPHEKRRLTNELHNQNDQLPSDQLPDTPISPVDKHSQHQRIRQLVSGIPGSHLSPFGKNKQPVRFGN